jgi:hypothetical protein
MLTYEDCLEMADLTDDEVEAISAHEHIPEIVAAELGNYLVHDAEGVPMIKRIILDDMEQALVRVDQRRALHLKLVLRRFVETHPDNRPA